MAQRARGAGARPAGRRGVRVPPPSDSRSDTRSGPDLATVRTRVRSVIEPLVVAAGLDLEELSVTRAGRRHVVRVTVDGDGGVGHDELSDISHEISAALDAAEAAGGDLTVDAYTLEVSSPGIDRPLTLPRHWRRNVGRLVTARAGDRTVTARVVAADDAQVTLDGAGGVRTVPYADLGPGRVQIEFTRAAELDDDELDRFEDEAPDEAPDETDDGYGQGSGDPTNGPTDEEDRA